MKPIRVLIPSLVPLLPWGLPWGLGLSCAATTDSRPGGASGGSRAAAEERAAAGRYLRRMFPGLEGEITREAIAAEIEAERASADSSSGVRAAAREAIEKGDFDRARDLLGELLAGEHVSRARELLTSGDPRAALASFDRALEMAPHSPSILCLRAEAALAVADLDHEPGVDAAALAESSLANFFEAASRDPAAPGDPQNFRARAWHGASRAARKLGRLEEAREYARRGLAAISGPMSDPISGPIFGPGPGSSETVTQAAGLRRALAEASLDAYLRTKSSGAAEAVGSHARETRDALTSLLGRTPEDAWTWERLALLTQSQGSPAEACDVALRGLRLAPDDRALIERLSLAAQELGGPQGVIAAFEPFCRSHPDLALAAWHLAQARFDRAISSGAMDPRAMAAPDSSADPRADLAAAAEGFARCRGLDRSLESDCRAMEAQCRGALGFWLLGKGDLGGAREAFLSMEDASKRGLSLTVRGVERRGSDGLFAVVEAYARRGDAGSPGSIDNLESAGRIGDLLHELEPEDARFAAGAGRANRETAVALELRAQALAGQGQAAEANRLLTRARETMEQSFRALDEATRLAPRDERVAAAAGGVLVRYLQRDPERARAWLESAVELGEAQVARLSASADEPGLPAAEREARRKLLEDEQALVGDACQDLGTLYLSLLGDPEHARPWLERSQKTGPDPRVEIEGLLARCREAIAGRLDPKLREENRWAAAIRPGRTP